MRLLYVSTLDHIIHVMLPHLDAARARGWSVDVACNVTRAPEITTAHCDALHPIPFARNPLHPKNLLATVELIRLIKHEKYDLVHCHNPSGGFFGRLAATLAGTKPVRVYTAHGFHFHPLGGRFLNALYRRIERFAGRSLSDAVLTINQWDFEQAQTLMPAEKVYRTPGVGVSTERFDPKAITQEQKTAIRAEFGVREGGFLVTCIGEMIPRKRHEDALRALSGYPKVTLALVGDGPLRSTLMQRACKMPGNVVFPGFRRDISEILAASDIFLFPSVQEGLPCSVQEALSMEIPVVAYDVRGCLELIDDSCGRLVPVGNASALGRAVAEVLALSPVQRRAMGQAGRQKMIQLYDRPECVAAWQRIYDELLERRQ